ncbi:MAG: S26 family signal peptidase [Candidatus Thermoplasmatota archaeon]|nr:S26 family signal peptidase [Candidatus Thermoplasmatota archaeon]
MRWKSALVDLGITLLAVGIIFGGIYAYTGGVFPPLVVVVSNSMLHEDANVGQLGTISPGDIVLVKGAENIIAKVNATETGYKTYGDYGDVIVYKPDGKDVTPVIHRAIMWVEKGQWVQSNETLGIRRSFIVPYDGFITKGDNNGIIDQLGGISKIVQKEWILGVAKGELPWLGLLSMLVRDRYSLSNVQPVIWVFMILELAAIFVFLDIIDRIIDRLARRLRRE